MACHPVPYKPSATDATSRGTWEPHLLSHCLPRLHALAGSDDVWTGARMSGPHIPRYVKALVPAQRRLQASCLCASVWAHQPVPPCLGQPLGPAVCVGEVVRTREEA